MSTESKYIDIKDAKNVVVKILKNYGSLDYSRLLMMTELPEDVLKKALELLTNNKTIVSEKDGDLDRYQLPPRGWHF